MKNIPPTCLTKTKHKLIKISDKKSCECYFSNLSCSSVKVILVDGCAIKTGTRCDFALISTSYPENYVELKGGDVNHAIDQIVSSMTRLSIDLHKTPKRCFIISTNNPLSSTQTQKFKLSFRKSYNAYLIFGRPGSSYDI